MERLRVLVLVDDLERRNGLVALLRGADHEVVIAPNGVFAAEAMREQGLDTLVIDLHADEIDRGALRQAVSPGGKIEPDSLEAAERRHLAEVLRHTDGNKRKAALLLGISRSTLLNKVRKYGLE